MYNDYGPVKRDAAEGNINSVNFPEFHRGGAGMDSSPSWEGVVDDMESELMWFAEYERRGLDMTMDRLQHELGEDILIPTLRVFVDVTDLYGKLYVQKDLTAHKK